MDIAQHKSGLLVASLPMTLEEKDRPYRAYHDAFMEQYEAHHACCAARAAGAA